MTANKISENVREAAWMADRDEKISTFCVLVLNNFIKIRFVVNQEHVKSYLVNGALSSRTEALAHPSG